MFARLSAGVAGLAAAALQELPVGAAPKEEGPAVRREALGSLWMSVLLPLVVLGIATRMAHERPGIAAVFESIVEQISEDLNQAALPGSHHGQSEIKSNVRVAIGNQPLLFL